MWKSVADFMEKIFEYVPYTSVPEPEPDDNEEEDEEED